MTRPELVGIAEHFWRQAGMAPSEPRSVQVAVSWAHSVRVETQPDLSIATVQSWMDRQGFPVPIDDPNRRLRGCAVASAGSGLIFVDASDPPNEREFTVAHEAAHLLLDYYGPRGDATVLIGDSAHEVFDGVRDATFPERLTAALNGEALRPFIHLLARDANFVASAAVLTREALADELACELLAPMDDVRRELSGTWTQAKATSTLVEQFRLPEGASEEYARRLARRFRPTPTFVDWLG